MGREITGTIYVEGMFCANCEKRIREGLLALEGVKSADASFEKGTVKVCYDEDSVSADSIGKVIEKLGYEVSHRENRYVRIASLLIIILAVYIIADHLGWTRIFNIFPSIETSLSMGMLFVIGLLVSVHCIAMCGGINLTQSTMAAAGGKGTAMANIAYNCGRVISYTVIGGIVGAAGSVISFGGAFRGIVAVTAGVIMVIMSLSMLGIFKPLRRLPLHLPAGLYRRLAGKEHGRSSFIIGLLNGLMPCGPLQSMQIYALSTGSALAGALSMLIFSLGTVPLMLGFGLFSGRLNRKYARYMLTVSAMLIFVMGIHMTGSGLSMSGVPVLPPAVSRTQQTAVLSGDRQYVQSEVDHGSYESIRVRKGIPVEWTIYVPEGKLNGCNNEILVPAYDLDIRLSEGENTVRFTPENEGSFPYSCWMGMINSNIEVVDD